MPLQIPIDPGAIAELCQRWGIQRLAVFGSAVRDDFHEGSDVDVMVTYQDRTPGLSVVTLQDELTSLFGRQVDLVTEKFLHPLVKEQAMCDREVLYDAKSRSALHSANDRNLRADPPQGRIDRAV